MPEIQNYAGRNLVVRLHNADNSVFAFIDDELLINRGTENDPAFQEDFKKVLNRGQHRLIIGGINWGGPAHFRYSIILDDVTRDTVDIRPNIPHGLAYHQVYIIDSV